MVTESWVSLEQVERVRLQYLQRLERLTKASLAEEQSSDSTLESVHRLQSETLLAEHMALIGLRDNGTISDEVLHRLEQELDVAALHLGVGGRRLGRIPV